MSRKRVLITAAGALLALAIAGGAAYATIPGPGNVYHACMLKGLGTIRLIDKSLPSTNLMSRCTDKETEISWNQAGQPGPAGLQGAEGPKGDKGDAGNLALAGRSCPSGSFVTGFDSNGDVVCATPGDGSGGGGGGGGGDGSQELLITPLELAFPQTQVGALSNDLTLIFTNTGSSAVFVPITMAGADAGDFQLVGSCETVLAQGTCAFSVVFAPTAPGLRSAAIMVQRPTGDTVSIALSGTGV